MEISLKYRVSYFPLHDGEEYKLKTEDFDSIEEAILKFRELNGRGEVVSITNFI